MKIEKEEMDLVSGMYGEEILRMLVKDLVKEKKSRKKENIKKERE